MMLRDRHWFIACATLVWTYVIVRARAVPLVHDECASLLWYVYPGEWLPGSAHGDANNHFLSTGCGILFTRLFGLHPLSVRLGSVLAFVPYAWGCWRLGKNINSKPVRWCMWLALLTCPFVLDFFSLFRGYAMELAGWVIALDGCLRFAVSGSMRHLSQTLLGSLFATASILALVPVWALLITCLTVFAFLHHRRAPVRMVVQLVVILCAGVIPLLYASRLAMNMQEQGLLYHGSKEGFLPVTVVSLSRYVLGTDSAAWLVVIAAVMAVLVPVLRARSFKRPSTAALTALLLVADVVARVVLAKRFGVNYPEDRAGIHYVPLVILLFALAVDGLAVRDGRVRYAAIGLLLLPMRALFIVNTDHTLLWPEQSIPKRFVEVIHREGEHMDHAPVIGGYHQLALAWPMNARMLGEVVLPLQVDRFPEGDHDLRIVDHRFLGTAREGYRVLDSAMGPRLWLLERNVMRHVERLDTLRAEDTQGRGEFFEMGHVPDTLLRQGEILVDIGCRLSVDGISPDAGCVIEVNDSAGNKLLYDRVPLFALRREWKEGAWRMTRSLPRMPEARRAVIYFHNPEGKEVRLSAPTVVIGGSR